MSSRTNPGGELNLVFDNFGEVNFAFGSGDDMFVASQAPPASNLTITMGAGNDDVTLGDNGGIHITY